MIPRGSPEFSTSPYLSPGRRNPQHIGDRLWKTIRQLTATAPVSCRSPWYLHRNKQNRSRPPPRKLLPPLPAGAAPPAALGRCTSCPEIATSSVAITAK